MVLLFETAEYVLYSGYLGPGGLFDDNTVPGNCTGGAAGYIDKLILSENHIYSNPTPKEVYHNTTQPLKIFAMTKGKLSPDFFSNQTRHSSCASSYCILKSHFI